MSRAASIKLKELLRHKHVKKLLTARFISNFGNGMGPIAIAFGVLHLKGGTASELGLVLGSQTLGMILFSPFGGVLADKFGRIRMVAICDIWGSLGLIVQAFFFFSGSVPLWIMLVANINFGLMAGIWWPAFSGVLPAIVPDQSLQKANGLNAFVSNGAMISGAAIGGWLIAAFGASTGLMIDALSFLLSGLLLITLAGIEVNPGEASQSVIKDLKYGWKTFLSYRWIVIIVAGFSFIIMCWAAAENVIGPLIALKHFAGARSWSYVISAESVGFLCGSILGYRIKVRYPMRFLMIITLSISLYTWSMARPQSIQLIALSALLWGVTLDLWGALWSTALVLQVPREALSRVASFDAMGSFLLRPVGLIVAGPLMAWIGITRSLEVLSAFSAAIVALVLLSKDVRNMEMPTSTLSNQ